MIIAQGSLTLSGNTFFVNNASGTALGVGTYRLIQQASGSVTSGGGYAALISGSGSVGGTIGVVQLEMRPRQIGIELGGGSETAFIVFIAQAGDSLVATGRFGRLVSQQIHRNGSSFGFGQVQ